MGLRYELRCSPLRRSDAAPGWRVGVISLKDEWEPPLLGNCLDPAWSAHLLGLESFPYHHTLGEHLFSR